MITPELIEEVPEGVALISVSADDKHPILIVAVSDPNAEHPGPIGIALDLQRSQRLRAALWRAEQKLLKLMTDEPPLDVGFEEGPNPYI